MRNDSERTWVIGLCANALIWVSIPLRIGGLGMWVSDGGLRVCYLVVCCA